MEGWRDNCEVLDEVREYCGIEMEGGEGGKAYGGRNQNELLNILLLICMVNVIYGQLSV